MGLFCAPAWMMKGGGGAGAATISSMDAHDPYEKDKTKVKTELSNCKLSISNGNNKFVLSFKIVASGFTQNAANVEYRMRVVAGGKQRYTSVLGTANLEKIGYSVSINISPQINGNQEVKSCVLGDEKYVRILFETSTEICDYPIKFVIEKN